MATESPMRIVDSSGAGKWAPSRGAVVTDELGLLLRGHNNIHRDHSTKIAPNRSGSAPPSMEGSYLAFGNLVNNQQHSSNFGLENLQSGDVDPSYSPYYPLNTNLNPRIPPQTVLRGNNWRLPGSGSMYVSRSSLSIHEEEPEDDRSPKGASNTLSFTGRHKSLVDLIQEDFPRTPSPVFSSQTRSSSHVEEPFSHDIQSLSLDSLSLKASKSPEQTGTRGKTEISSGSTAKNESSSLDTSVTSLSLQKDELTSDLASGSSSTIGPDASKSFHKIEEDQEKQELGFNEQNELHRQTTTYPHHVGSHNFPISQEQRTSLGANNSSMDKFPYGHANITSQHPLYAPNAAYMAPGNSVYGNFGSSGLYSPQYSGYAMSSSFIPPYMAGYSPHTGFPLNFNANPGQNFGGQNAGIPTVDSMSKGSINRFYGHQMQPNFSDPLPLQYFQQDPYGVPLQYGHLPNTPSPTTAYTGDKKFQYPPNVSVSIPSPRNMAVPNSSYLNSPTALGFVPQFPSSPTLGSPVLPESPAGRRYDSGFSQSSVRNVGGWGSARWQGQRGGGDSVSDHSRKLSFLEELKASSARRIDLSDIIGRIVEFSADQHGSRFIQQKLENCSVEEKELVFKEVLPHAQKLITDVFGNYVIQKFFEHGTYEQRKELASQLSGQMLPLCLQMYGCRVIQKALEVIELDQKTELVLELEGHVMRCVRDQNGNHVIQKCIECVPTENIGFIISAFEGQVATLATHPYGCRVIQRILEHCSDDLQCRSIVDEVLESASELAQDQYGNYVTQHVLERGKPFERSQIISKLSGKIVQMSQHKYASNVVEKCLEFGDVTERELLIEEILVQSEDSDNLLPMMKDQFANYVVQKILEISNENQRQRLLDRIRLHLIALKKYTYGKHIVARFEQLCGEDNETSEP